MKHIKYKTKQEIFDRVASHLLTQNEKSVTVTARGNGDVTACMYRGSNGTMCAAGCLMSDKQYDPEFENCSWISLVSNKRISAVDPDDNGFIAALQVVHDQNGVERWRERLEQIGSSHKLNLHVLGEIA